MNVPKYIETLEVDNTMYQITEFINGGTLADLMKIRANKPLTLEEIQMITRKLQVVLTNFKKEKIFHRDLHMGQVMLRFRALERMMPY